MKMRSSFVANSSSSYFLVYFPVVPKSVTELRLFLFGTMNVNKKFQKSAFEEYCPELDDDNDNGDQIAGCIANPLGIGIDPWVDHRPASDEEIDQVIGDYICDDLLACGLFHDHPYREEYLRAETESMKKLWLMGKERENIFHLEFSDNEGDQLQNVICWAHTEIFARVAYLSTHKQ